jgi:MerR family copper efflux transcriptional regulator
MKLDARRSRPTTRRHVRSREHDAGHANATGRTASLGSTFALLYNSGRLIVRRQTQPRPELAEAKLNGYFNIGQASEASGVSAKMIRHYEEIGLVKPATRTFANYRIYSANDVHTLQFIKRARNVGFSMKQIGELLGLWQNTRRSSANVKKLALEHIQELETKIAEMQSMTAVLKELADYCHGDHRPDCPILDGLALKQDDGHCHHHA